MLKERIPETNEGIQNAPDVMEYDVFLRNMRDRGWLEADRIIESGITEGLALEVGPGPGYLGLEWLRKTAGTRLKGIEISRNMIKLACKNVKEYGFDEKRVEYILGNAMEMPFAENTFDAVFSNGSLHEWEDPVKILNEIYRVLKPGGRFLVSDLRRDVPLPVKWMFYAGTKPKSMRRGLTTSLQASYTKDELKCIVDDSSLKGAPVTSNPFGLEVIGMKKV